MDLFRDFQRAGLRLELPRQPIVRTNPEIFQMDIFRSRQGEAFRLWKGDDRNAVRVADVDRRIGQLTLLVREEMRTFTQSVSKYWAERNGVPGRIVRETDRAFVVERSTPASLRRYLCGLDERHYFIAQFENGTTVKDAHRRLKPAEVVEAERSRPGRTLRQGEWFFLPVPSYDRRGLDSAKARRFASLGGNGRPHVADEVVVLNGRTYARGAVRHPDHKTLVLDDWRIVHRNAEVRPEGDHGIYWID